MEPGLTILDGVEITTLERINHPKGDVYHALKATEESFSGFGEAYFTTVYKDHLKGWKQHTQMIMNLVVPVGMVRFHFYNESIAKGAFLEVGLSNYVRITIQPCIWVAFEGLSENLNLILNIASIPHDPEESRNTDLDVFPIYNRSVKQ